MALQLTTAKFAKDMYIIVEGKKADKFFIIREGKVQLSKEAQVVAEEQGDLLGPGDLFGVVSTMSNHNHIESAKALTDVLLIPIHREQFDDLIQSSKPIAMKIILQFSQRMRHLDKALTKLTLKNEAAEDETHFIDVANYYAKQSQFNAACYAYSRYITTTPSGKDVDYAKKQLQELTPQTKSLKIDFAPNENIRQYTKDAMVFCEGEVGNELYIIQKGSVKIVKVVDNNEVLIAVLKAGDIFGEMAILESKPRAASAVAYEDCVLMAVSRENFGQLTTSQPQIVTRLTTLLADRVWLIYKQLANTQLDNPLGKMFDALNIQLEKKRIEIDAAMIKPFTFDFGIMELIKMVGLSNNDGKIVADKMMENRCIEIVDDKIFTKDVREIPKQTSYYRKMEAIEKARKNTATA